MAQISHIKACVFDAYGTLLDVNSAALRCKDDLGALALPLSETWRAKQLQYTWLRSLMAKHVDFRQITEDALDFALDTHNLNDTGLRAKLLDLYEVLDAYPEVPSLLTTLKEAQIKTAILSNGSPDMLNNAVTAAGIGSGLDAVLSVEDVGIYKPHPSVYQLAVDRLGTAKESICFVSSNGWDAAGAAAFGFSVVWVNRSGQKPEQLGLPPKAVLQDLTGLPALILD